MTWQQWLAMASVQLTNSKTPRREAEILLCLVSGVTRTKLLAFGETELSNSELVTLNSLLIRRQGGEPIAYITGEKEFWSLSFKVNTATIIPRPDTECLVEQALKLVSIAVANVLDLGTGTGAIALALASERQSWQLTGIDLCPDAVVLASTNAIYLRLSNVSFLCGSWFKPLHGQRYNLIVSNPPYIDVEDPHLWQGDVRFEPRSALVAGNAGLADLATICYGAGSHLLQGAWLVMEHGWLQGAAVRTLLAYSGFKHISTIRDYGNNERISLGQWIS